MTNFQTLEEAQEAWKSVSLDMHNAYLLDGTVSHDFLSLVWDSAYQAGKKEKPRCIKLVENGKAICSVVLDCHLHDWRQRDEIEKARREGYQAGVEKCVESLGEKIPDADLSPGFNITAEYRLGELRGSNQRRADMLEKLKALRK